MKRGKTHSVQPTGHGLGSVEARKGPRRKVILAGGFGGMLVLATQLGGADARQEIQEGYCMFVHSLQSGAVRGLVTN